jgi:hypothetical protein
LLIPTPSPAFLFSNNNVKDPGNQIALKFPSEVVKPFPLIVAPEPGRRGAVYMVYRSPCQPLFSDFFYRVDFKLEITGF